MKYGKTLRDEIGKTFPEWGHEFISYKKLKKEIKLMGIRSDSELDKINAFYADKEEDYIIRLKELQIRVMNLDCEEEKLKVRMDILAFHAEMISLLRYSVLNFTGLIKIVKKHKKKTGTSVHCFHFMPSAIRQPCFSTDLLSKLMNECEVMLRCLT